MRFVSALLQRQWRRLAILRAAETKNLSALSTMPLPENHLKR